MHCYLLSRHRTIVESNIFKKIVSLLQMVAELQRKFLKESYPSANHIQIKGADRRMIYEKPSAISQHLRRLVTRRQAKQQSQ